MKLYYGTTYSGFKSIVKDKKISMSNLELSQNVNLTKSINEALGVVLNISKDSMNIQRVAIFEIEVDYNDIEVDNKEKFYDTNVDYSKFPLEYKVRLKRDLLYNKNIKRFVNLKFNNYFHGFEYVNNPNLKNKLVKLWKMISIGEGNTNGNISNDGLFAEDEKYIYFSNFTENSKLYKVDKINKELTKLSDDSCCFVNAINEYIIYSCINENYKIYKISKDGKDKTNLVSDCSKYVIVHDQWVYYSNHSDGCKVYKIDINGRNKTIISDDKSWYLNYYDGYIYYRNCNDNGSIYGISINGELRKKINSDDSRFLNTIDGWIYYVNLNGNNIYKINVEGNYKKQLNYEGSDYINVFGNWIYYHSRYKICRIDLHGNIREIIENSDALYINVVDNYLFYFNEEDRNKLFRSDLIGEHIQEANDNPLKDQDNIRKFGLTKISNNLSEFNIKFINQWTSLDVVKDWVYFRDSHGSLNKIRNDGTKSYSFGDYYYMKIDDEWIYHLNYHGIPPFIETIRGVDVYRGKYSKFYQLYRTSVDGLLNEKISGDRIISREILGAPKTPEFIFEDNWIYYSNYDDKEKLYRIKIDGTNKQKICEDICTHFVKNNDHIFYVNYDDEKMYKVNVNNKEIIKLSDEKVYSVEYVNKEHIFYFIDRQLYKMKKDGTEKQTCSHIKMKFPYYKIKDDCIYYINESGNMLYKSGVDNTDSKKLINCKIHNFKLDKEHIYFTNDKGLFYRCNLEGKELFKISDLEVSAFTFDDDWLYYTSTYRPEQGYHNVRSILYKFKK